MERANHAELALAEKFGACAAWQESLTVLERHMPFTRRNLRTGEALHFAGDAFTRLHIVCLGSVKTVAVASNGRQQVVGLHFQGDWFDFDAVATRTFACDAYAMESSEVWGLCYATLLKTAANVPELMCALIKAMGRQVAYDREWRFAMGTLQADARVAEFIRYWSESLVARRQSVNSISLSLTRAEVGNYLGMTLETVSRSINRLARSGLIVFQDKGHRHFVIPCSTSLARFIEQGINLPARAVTRYPAIPARLYGHGGPGATIREFN